MSILSILLVILSMSIHEIGHFVAMTKNKLSVDEVSLIGMGNVLFRFRTKYFPRTLFTIRLFPVGASVRPSTYSGNRMQYLPLKEQSYILVNGVRYNIYIACICLVLQYFNNYNNEILILSCSMFFVAFISRWVHYVWFVLGLFFIGFISYNFKDVIPTVSVIDTYTITYKNSDTYSHLLKSIFWINISIATFNVLPLFPLDGGRLLLAYVVSVFPNHRRSLTKASYFTGIPIALLIIFAIGKDILRIF